MSQRALLLANRNSRHCADLFEPACDALRKHGIETTVPKIPAREQIPHLIKHHAPSHDCIIAMGGDGSINAALSGVMECGLPLGILPAGTANDLARTLGLPDDIFKAVEVIAKGNTRDIDVAEVNGIAFVNAASVGLSVEITRRLDKPLKKKWGKLAYVIAATRSLVHARPFSAEVNLGSESTTVKSVQLVVGNGRYFGTGMTVDAEAEIDDGVMHLYAVKALPWWRIVTLLPTLRAGTHAKSDSVVNLTGAEMTVRTLRPRTVTADGEILTKTPARFLIRPKAIRVFV